jgi:hypothetical protein
MYTLKITLQRQPKDSDSYPVVVEHSPPLFPPLPFCQRSSQMI